MRDYRLALSFLTLLLLWNPLLLGEESSENNEQAAESPKETIQAGLSAEGATGAEGDASADGGASTDGGAVRGAPATVGKTGALTQSYPIAVLPARAGMAPSLALVYSSANRHNGWVGFGWDFDIGTLSRRGTRGNPLPPNSYNPKSFFPADNWKTERYEVSVWGQGQELFYDPSHSDPGTVRFSPRYQTHWKVEAPVNSNEFDEWKAYDASGHIYYFRSHLAASDQKRSTQFLTKITSIDHTNLFVDYGIGTPYMLGGEDIGSRAVYPVTIHYSCEQTTDACDRVEFVWEERDDPVISVASGTLVAWTKRLKEIQVKTPTGQVAWRYLFTYTTDPYNRRSLLAAIARVDGEGKQLLPPTTFTYQQNGAPTEKWPEQKTTLDCFAYYLPYNSELDFSFYIDGGAFFTDLNNDGLPDQVRRFRGSNTNKTPWDANWINQGNGKFTETDLAQSFWISGKTETAAAQFGDFNGDGSLEIFKNSGGNIGGLKDGILDLSGAAISGAPALPIPFYQNGANQGVRVLDVNGDGFADLMQGNQSGSGDLVRAAWLYDTAAQKYVPHPEWNPPVDFTVYGKGAGVREIDLNGDGLIDLYRMSMLDPKSNGIFLNTGNGWLNVTSQWTFEWPNGMGPPPLDQTGITIQGKWYPNITDSKGRDVGWQFVDINGDGITDLVLAVEKYTSYLLLGTTQPRFIGQPSVSLPASLTANWKGYSIYPSVVGQNTGVRFVDVNGDLLVDMVESVDAIESFDTAANGHTATLWRNPLLRPSDLLTEVHTPLGATTSFQYATYAKVGEEIGLPRVVVKRMELRMPDGALVTGTDYTYAKPELIGASDPDYMDSRGPEFLGFLEIARTEIGSYRTIQSASGDYTPGKPSVPTKVTTETTEASRRRVTTTYRSGYAMAGQVEKTLLEVSNNKGGSWTSLASTQYSYHDAGHPGVSLSPPYQSIAKTVTTQSLEGKPVTVVRQYPQHDTWGNPTSIVDDGRTDLLGDEVTIEQSYLYLTDPRIIGLPLVTKVTDGAGAWRRQENVYDPQGRLATTTTTASLVNGTATTAHQYDQYGNVTTILRSASGASTPMSTLIEYDPTYHQWPTKVTNPLGQYVATTYYGINATDPFTESAAFGRVARRYALATNDVSAAVYQYMTYDNFGRPAALSTRDVATGTDLVYRWWAYNPKPTSGEYETTMWDLMDDKNKGATPTVVTLDALGRMIHGKRRTTISWLQADVEYGPFGAIQRVSNVHAPEGPIGWTTTTVDAVGRPSTIEGFSHTQIYGYEGFVTRVTNGQGQTTEIERDARGRTIRTTGPGGAVTTIVYGQPSVTIKGPDGTSTLFHQDGLGRLLFRVDPDRGTRGWQYDALGHLTFQKDAKGNITHFAYDPLGRVTGIDDQADGIYEIQYFYDGATPTSAKTLSNALGRRTGMSDPSGSTQWNYNSVGQLTWVTKQLGDEAYGLSLSYDPLGRMVEEGYFNAAAGIPKPLFTVQYTHTENGLKKIAYQLGVGQAWKGVVTDVEYDPQGRITNIFYGNDTVGTNEYTAGTNLLASHRVKIGSELLLGLTYTYDTLLGTITGIHDELMDKFDQTFTYDKQGWLASATSKNYGEILYYATPAGNLENHGPWTLHYDSARPHAVKWADNDETKETIQYVYDANGNVTNAGNGRLLSYNHFAQISRIESPYEIVDFTYDGDGRRVKQALLAMKAPPPPPPPPPSLVDKMKAQLKAIFKKPTMTTKLPASDAVKGSKGTVGAMKVLPTGKSTLLLKPFPSMEVLISGRGIKHIRYHIDAFGDRVATIDSDSAGTSHFYYTDHLGSNTVVMEQNGAKSTRYAPFGVPLNAAGKADWTGLPDRTNTYVGVDAMPAAALLLTGPRAYDPILGRFLQPDPIPGSVATAPSRNPYTYAMNNPIMFRDPSGLQQVAIGERMQVGEDGGSGFSLRYSYSSAGGNHQGNFGGDPGGYNSYTGPNSGGGHHPYAVSPLYDMVDPYYNEKSIATDPDGNQQRWAISQFEAMDFVAEICRNHGVSVPAIEFWPETGVYYEYEFNVSALAVYDRRGEVISVNGISEYYIPTIFIGGITPTTKTVAHELGHHLDAENILNKSGKLGAEFVADMFALGELERRGIGSDNEQAAMGYKSSYRGAAIAEIKCISSQGVGNCPEFWKALEDGDETFFSLDTLIEPPTKPRFQDMMKSLYGD